MPSYDIIYADPPWSYYGDPNKCAAAGKHYSLMTDEDIAKLPVSHICNDPAVLYLWATSPRLDSAIWLMKEWGFTYRTVGFVWVKTRRDGGIIQGQGVRPSFVKPTTEFLLIGSTVKKGRTLPVLKEGMGQVVLHPRLEHSEKPDVFRERIVELHGDRSRIELFARQRYDGWHSWGNEVKSDIWTREPGPLVLSPRLPESLA